MAYNILKMSSWFVSLLHQIKAPLMIDINQLGDLIKRIISFIKATMTVSNFADCPNTRSLIQLIMELNLRAKQYNWSQWPNLGSKLHVGTIGKYQINRL